MNNNQKIKELLRYCQLSALDKRIADDDKLYALKELMAINGFLPPFYHIRTVKNLLWFIRDTMKTLSLLENEFIESLETVARDNPEILEELSWPE